jgi:hypothetical protein
MMNRLKDYVRFIHGFQVYRPSHVDSVPYVNKGDTPLSIILVAHM